MILLSGSWACFIDEFKKTNLLVHDEIKKNGKVFRGEIGLGISSRKTGQYLSKPFSPTASLPGLAVGC